jgi:hypothetical protein
MVSIMGATTMKTYRVFRGFHNGKSKEFVKVPALDPGHAISVAMAKYSWARSEIEFAEEFDKDWTGPLWYVFDRDGFLLENEDKSLMEFALEDGARKAILSLPGKGYDTRKEFVFRIRDGLWRRKKKG